MWITVLVFLLLSLELLLDVPRRGDGSCICCSCVGLSLLESLLLASVPITFSSCLCLGNTFHGLGTIMFPILIVAVSPSEIGVIFFPGDDVKNSLAIVILCDDKNDNENDSINNNSSNIQIVYNTNTDRRLVLKYRCRYMYRNNKKLLFRNKDFFIAEFFVPLRRRKLPLLSFFCAILFRNDVTIVEEEEDVVCMEDGVPTIVWGCMMED